MRPRDVTGPVGGVVPRFHRTTMTDDNWEPVARETLWQALQATSTDVEATVESVASTVYFDRDLDAEQIDRMRQAVADLAYVTETYLAALCEETDPWPDEDDRAPSWQPLDERHGDDSSASEPPASELPAPESSAPE